MFSSQSYNPDGMYSVYIPTIHNSYTEHSVRVFFELNHTGEVVRVDFAPFKNDEKKGYRHAFVHFNPLSRTNNIMKTIEEEGSYRFYPYEKQTRMNTQISEKQQNEYWIFLKNKAPVPETEQNIHQLSHNAKLMEEREAQMVQKIAQMEEHAKQMEERMAKMEDKMSSLIQLNEKFASIIEVQSININTISRMINIKEEEPVVKVKEEIKVKEEEGMCRICHKVEVPQNEVVCAECWKHCEPAMPFTREGIESEFRNIKTEGEERYWRFYEKFEEQLGQYSKDTMWLFDSSTKEIEKLAEKNGKSVEDIQYCIERINYIRTSSRHAEERTNRIMEVVYYLVEQVAGKEVSDIKLDFMKFNYIEKNSGLPLEIEELL